ncbi:MAG: alpha/beta fold hydrolase [Planctomycetaceae bacterium]
MLRLEVPRKPIWTNRVVAVDVPKGESTASAGAREEKLVSHPQVALHAVERGEGEPLLLVHGFGASIYSWRFLVDELAKTRRVIAIDLKGFGDSPKPLDDAYTLRDQVALVSAFIRERELRNLTLVGHSYGGGVSLLTALGLQARNEDRLARLVLIDNVAYPQEFPFFIRALRTPLLGPLGAWMLPATLQARKVLELCYHDPRRITDEQVESYAAPLRTPAGRHALIETARRVLPPDMDRVTAGYKTLALPTLLLWGWHDRVVPLEIGARLHAELPNAELAVIADAGHIPQEEKPAETLALLREWLNADV